jgi:tetratricopeptide (TPR) repeat protein
MVFLFAGLLLGSPGVTCTYVAGNRKTIRLFTALIFAVHPIQTESVTYIVQRMESLAGFFYISALIFYFMFRSGETGKRRAAVIAGFAVCALLAVLTKQTSYTMPLAILLLEIFFIRDQKGRCNRHLVFGISAVLFLSLVVALGADILPRESMSDISRSDYLTTQFKVIPQYFRLMIIPAGQNIDHHVSVPASFIETGVILGIVVILFMFFSAYYLFRKGHRVLSFSIMWIFAVLSLRSSVLPISDLMTERRLYTAVFGYGLFVPVLFYYLKERYSGIQNKNAVPIILTVLIVILSAATFNRNKVWKDELSLWKDSVEKSPDKFRPNYNVAEAYKKKGFSDEALEYYKKAYSINPRSYGLCNNIGNIYSEKQMWNDAEKFYTEALSIKPDYSKALNNLANVYFKKKDFVSAERFYIKAIEADAYYADPVLNLGHLYYMGGYFEQAGEKYRELLRIEPGSQQAKNNLKIIENNLKNGN